MVPRLNICHMTSTKQSQIKTNNCTAKIDMGSLGGAVLNVTVTFYSVEYSASASNHGMSRSFTVLLR
jgi:hypothetical protein